VLLCELRAHRLAQAEKATTTPRSRQESRDALILIYLSHVDTLLRRYVLSAYLDYEDLRQDAVLVILHCLDKKPEQQSTLHGYICTSVRHRILDKIRYNQCHQIESLDVPASRVAGNESIGDLLPSGYSIDPLLVLGATEERFQVRVRAKEALRSLPARQRRTKRVQKAIALFQEEGLP
jgi:DNA-directed RNA polymerase specialized sigma24 family protein